MERSCFPRFLLAGLRGGSGKTLVSLGLGRVLTEKGYKIKAFKKGPDYIDAKWLSLAVGSEASNLDPFLFPKNKVKDLFFSFRDDFDLALVEGNRGLFDGKDIYGSFSTAELAKLLGIPVILVVDCTKITRTMAAIVLGINSFEPNLNLAGVILNRTAGPRHRKILRDSIEYYTDVPVLGILPKLKTNPIPERHMGLISDQEYNQEVGKIFQTLSKVCKDNLDIERIINIAQEVPLFHKIKVPLFNRINKDEVCIGIVKDSAFWFYYEENFKALEAAGAKLKFLSLLDDSPWPEIDALYIGGGFPETLALQLENNRFKRQLLNNLANSGLPIYAECGGLMFLSRSITFHENTYQMANVFPIDIGVQKKPKGHGYVEGEINLKNPFFPKGYKLLGHEFHYSYCLNERIELDFALNLARGVGVCSGKDGIIYKNVFASYTHIHALGNPKWARNFVLAAKQYQLYKQSNTLPAPKIIAS
ncbi:cobyrinic acid a,c-diamide synthase [Desulfonauticus submarinus]|uniref:Cobyrinate a,c-diamide synthase n=1 Tax=Desulfonauticus submarinus TaxID=206665 RepID=A0A1H0CJA6_9BACT|nr:cobyrinate a,c-diamide synthase [Desulfonauticus submarinus]SDN57920.1 cobyrinic acid a,c-diamide synthase [Desulfonauticus submarinus]